MLDLMRLVQREMTLRENTRQLEKAKESRPSYKEDAVQLSQDQLGIGRDVIRLAAKAFHPDIQERLREASRSISDAATLLQKPQTDGETIAAETEAIEWLGKAAESSSQGGGNQSSGVAAMMEMMMEMQISNSPGGNAMGGVSSLASDEARGKSERDDTQSRKVSKASGAVGGDFPEEFREALGHYFERREAWLQEHEATTPQ